MLYPMAFSKNEVQVCARYSFVCETGDTACTAAEQKSRARRWSYVPLAKSTCDTLGKVPGARAPTKNNASPSIIDLLCDAGHAGGLVALLMAAAP
jgi:hypothetical protein